MVAVVACARLSPSGPPSDTGAITLDATDDGTPGDSAPSDRGVEGEPCPGVRALSAGTTFVDEVLPPASGRSVALCDESRPMTHALVLRATVPPGERIAVAAERPAIDVRNISVEITADCLGERCMEGGEPPPSDSTPRRARYINTTDRPQTVFVRLGSRVTAGPAWGRALIHVGAVQDNSTCARATPLVVDGPPLAQQTPDFPTPGPTCGTAPLPQAYYRVTAAPGEAIAVRVDGQPGGADFHVLNGCGLRCSATLAGMAGSPYVFVNATAETAERILIVSRQNYTLRPYLLTAQRVALDPHANCDRPFALTLEQGYTLDPSREGLTPVSASCYGPLPYVHVRVELPAGSTRWLVVRSDAPLANLSWVYAVNTAGCLFSNCGGAILSPGRTVGSLRIENTSDAPATRLIAVGRVGITTPISVSLSLTAP